MNRVLIVTYYFPPRPAVGSLRPRGLAKYLPEFGWEPVILTPRLPEGSKSAFNIIETGYRESLGFAKRHLGLDPEQNLLAQVAQLKKKLHIRSERSFIDTLLTFWGELTAYPDTQKGWRSFAVKTGHTYLQHESVKAIISTSSPVTSHVVAKELKDEHNIPWVADFRDLWTQNHYYPYSRIRKVIERRLEQRTLGPVDALVTTSEPWAKRLGLLHQGKTVYAITNGFDPEEGNNANSDLTNKFTITHTGNLYPGKQSPESLFAALKDLIARRVIDARDIEVRFYGSEVGWIDKQAEQYGLTDIVKQFGIVSREAVLKGQRESQVLLLIKWDDPGERGAYTAKIFEYLAAGRPILAIGGYEDVVSELLTETETGACANTVEEVKDILTRHYQDYQTAGRVSYNGVENNINRYSQREMARKFAEVLEKVSGIGAS